MQAQHREASQLDSSARQQPGQQFHPAPGADAAGGDSMPRAAYREPHCRQEDGRPAHLVLVVVSIVKIRNHRHQLVMAVAVDVGDGGGGQNMGVHPQIKAVGGTGPRPVAGRCLWDVKKSPAKQLVLTYVSLPPSPLCKCLGRPPMALQWEAPRTRTSYLPTGMVWSGACHSSSSHRSAGCTPPPAGMSLE